MMREHSLPGFGIGMTSKSTEFDKVLLVEDAELVWSEGSGVAAATYSFNNLVCCKCHC